MEKMQTRDKILNSASKLFANDGFEKVSTRQVTQHAEVNLAAISYHFGGKDQLIQEVIAGALIPMNRQRVRLLKLAGETNGGLDQLKLRTIIEAYIQPVVSPEEHGGSPNLIARILSRCFIERDLTVSKQVVVSFSEIHQIFGAMVCARCPHLTQEQALEKLIFSIGFACMFQTFDELTKNSKVHTPKNSEEEHSKSIVDFCESGFQVV